MTDAVVIGAGPNGLAGAIELARHGWDVLVLEAQDRPGGALYSVESTLPGYAQDVGAAFFPFATASPAFREFRLDEVGLEWRTGVYESAHPAPDGTCPAISRDVDRSAATFGADGGAWRRLHRWQEAMGERLVGALLGPLPNLGAAWKLGPRHLFWLGLDGLSTTAGYARRRFATPAARRVVPALALHVDLGPHDLAGTGLGLVLALTAARYGFAVPVGGAKSITDALVRRLEGSGGRVRLATRATQVVVRDRRAVAVRTEQGDEIPVRRAVLADVGAPALYLRMLEPRHTPHWLAGSIRRFRYGWGTFKMDWALAGPVPWHSAPARQSSVVHTGDSVEDLLRFTRQARSGQLPDNPYLVIGQQSLVDPTRAPAGGHTLWAYSRVPSHVPGGWAKVKEMFADRIEQRIEQLAPGFRDLIRARAVWSPADLEAMDENLVGGDLGGGSAQITQQLFFRPAFPYFRYGTHIRGLYLASASAHPGAGVHGACGFNAARMALREGSG